MPSVMQTNKLLDDLIQLHLHLKGMRTPLMKWMKVRAHRKIHLLILQHTQLAPVLIRLVMTRQMFNASLILVALQDHQTGLKLPKVDLPTLQTSLLARRMVVGEIQPHEMQIWKRKRTNPRLQEAGSWACSNVAQQKLVIKA